MAQPAPAPTKSILASKTFWWNVLSIVYYLLGQTHMVPQLDPQVQGLLTGAVNIGLRVATNQGVHIN